jgi:hypothetical protein
MSSLTSVVPLSQAAPFAIYNGPRTGDAFLEWNLSDRSRARKKKQMRRRTPQSLAGIGFTEVGSPCGMGQMVSLPSALQSFASTAIPALELSTQLTGPIVIDKPFTSSGRPRAQAEGGTFAQTLLPFLKPALYARIPGGGKITLYEPNGPPTDYSGQIALAIGVALATAGLIGAWIGKRMLCETKSNPKRKR